MKPKPKVIKRHDSWLIQLPPFGFSQHGGFVGSFPTQPKAFAYALAWVEKHGGGTVTVSLADIPESTAWHPLEGFGPVIR